MTLVLRSSGGTLNVAFEDGRVVDLRNTFGRGGGFLFTGICLMNPEFLARIPADTVISVVPIFCEMIRTGAKLGGVVIDDGGWWDLGTREEYLAVHRALHGNAEQWISPTAAIAGTAQISGATAIGDGARIGDGVKLHDCIVWENAEIGAGSTLERCIITDGALIEGTHTDADF